MANNDQKEKDPRKGARITLTIFAYLFFICVAATVLPVVMPMIFGYHTYTVEADTTGNVPKPGSVIYTDKTETAALSSGNIVAIAGEGKRVKVYYVDSNDSAAKTIALRTGDTAKYDQVKGRVVAKTPFIGLLTQLLDSIAGIVITAAVFVVGVVFAIIANRLTLKKKQ